MNWLHTEGYLTWVSSLDGKEQENAIYYMDIWLPGFVAWDICSAIKNVLKR